MQVPMSSYLVEIKPQIQELIRLLEREFDYVSVLCTDVKGTTYRVSMHQTTVGDYHSVNAASLSVHGRTVPTLNIPSTTSPMPQILRRKLLPR